MTTDGPGAEANDETEPGDAGPDVAICPHCMAELPPMADFCPACRGPVTAYANTAYYEGALAEGWSLGESVTARRPSVVTLIGIWAIFLPTALFTALALVAGWGQDGPAWLTFVYVPFLSAWFALCVWCLYRGTRNFVVRRREARRVSNAAPPDAPAPPST